ncbi:MAG: PAS domain-containing sensor histidine kinase [Chitinophagaceae bacterium]
MPLENKDGSENSDSGNQERLDALTAALGDMVFEVDRECRILQIWANNPQLLILPGKIQPGKLITEVFPDEFGLKLVRIISTSLETGEVISMDLTSPIPGDKHFFQARLTPWNKQEGQFSRLFMVINDVTATVLTDHLLRSKDERYNLTIFGINAGIWDWNIREGTEWWSPKFFELLGYQDQELEPGYHGFVDILCHPDDRARLLYAGNKHRFHHQTYKEEIRLLHKSGQYRWFETSGQAQRNESGEAIRMVGSIIDIHPKKMMELQLRENQERLEILFRYSPIGIGLLAPEGNWLQVNQFLCEMVGYQQEELLQLNYQKITHPDDLPLNMELTSCLLNGEMASYEMEKRYIHKDGYPIWTLLRATLVRDQEGKILYGIALTMDISKRKEQETEKEKVILTLNRQNDQLNNFAYIISHNLRSHAANLQMLNHLYEESLTPEEQQLFFEKIKLVSQSLGMTIEHLTQIVNVTHHPVQGKELIHFDSLYEQVCHSLEADILQTGTCIETDFAQCPTLEYPIIYMESILLNLLTNAIKYRSPERKPQIWIKTFIRENRKILSCSDNGMGIDLEKHGKNLFGLYKTFHKHPDARGIGLFLVKNQVESMGGSIQVFSKPGQGTRFEIQF